LVNSISAKAICTNFCTIPLSRFRHRDLLAGAPWEAWVMKVSTIGQTLAFVRTSMHLAGSYTAAVPTSPNIR